MLHTPKRYRISIAPSKLALGAGRLGDANVDGAELLAMMLDLAGYETRAAYDGPAALVVVRELAPEVVFLDIGMPGMDGHEWRSACVRTLRSPL